MDDELLIRIKTIMEGDASKQLEELKKQSEAVAQAQGKQSEAAKAYAKEVETMSKYQLEAGKDVQALQQQEAKQLEALAQGRKTYSQVIKEEKATMEALYQKKQAMAKVYGEESEAVKGVDEALQKQIKSVAKLEDENNALKNSLDSVRKELTPLQRDLKQASDGVDKLDETTKDAKTSMKEYANSLDLATEKLTASEAKWKQVNRLLEETNAKLQEGDAEFSAYEDRMKALAQGMLELQKAGEGNSAEFKKLSAAYKEAAKSAYEYKILEEQVASAAEGGVAKFDSVSTSLSNVANVASNIGGDLGNLIGSFAGLGSSIASLPAQFDAIAKSGAKGFSAFAQNLTAGIAAIGPMVMMAYDALDGLIRKQEQATIDAGKKATETSNQFKSYALGNKTLEDRIKLIDEVAKSDQKMASSLRGLASDSEAFDAKLKQVNKSLLETREKGMGKEWEVEQTGGGLFGWMKKIGTATEEMAANMGKARVAIDEFRAGVSETGKDLQTAMDASASYQGGVEDRIRSMQIAIENAKGNIARVRELEIEGLEREKETTKKLINDKLELIKIRQIDAKIQAAQVNTQILNQQKIINNMTDFRNDDSTQSIINSTFGKSEKELQTFMTKFREIIDTNVKYYDEQEELVSETIAELTHTFGKQFTQAANMADLSVKEFFTNLVKGDADVKNYITSMRELIPAQQELKNGANLYKNAIKELQDQLDPKNEKSIERALDRLIAKQRELWAVEDAKNKKDAAKPGKSTLEKYTAPQLTDMGKEVDYYINLRKTVFEKLGKDFDFGIPYWKKSMDSETKKLAESIAKDNTLQDALKAQQTKLADLEKQLPKLTGTARTEAEKQIQQARGSIATLTEELNNALQNTASIRANIVLSAQEAVKDVANLDSMTAIQNQTKDWQAEIDKIMAGYDKLSDAGKLAAQTQIAAINGVINSLADQSTAMAIAVRKSVEAAKSDNKGLEDLYKKAKEASDAAHDTRTQAQKDEDAYQKKLADTKKYYDDLIEAAKNATYGGGKYATSDLIALEEMRNNAIELIEDTKALTDETKAYQDAIAKATAEWGELKTVMSDIDKTHEEWLKKFDPAAYEELLDSKKFQSLNDQLSTIATTATATLNRLGKMTAEEISYWEKKLGIVFDATNGWQDEYNAILAFFTQAVNEATALANATDKTTTNLDASANSASKLKDEIKELTDNAGKFEIKFDLDGFLKDFDNAMNGAPIQDVFQKLDQKYNDAIDKLNKEYLDKGAEEIAKYKEKTLGEVYGSDKERQAFKEYLEAIAKLDAEYGQKRIDNAKNTALEVAAAYKSELEKLEQMQKSFDDRIKSREKMTGDARVEVANYVSRSKMTTAQRDADDLAKGIADQYQKYLAAGMSEVELAEWVALKKKEALTGKDAETTKWFEKQWEERSKAARESARLDKEAFDAETTRMQTALDKQKELVDNLKGLADKAKNSLIAMLEQLGITAAGIIDATPKAGDATGEATQKGSSTGSRAQGIELKDGMLYSQVKNQLTDSQKPSAAMIAEIGVAGVTDLEYRNGRWARYRKQTTAADTGKPADTGKAEDKPTPKGEAVPLETSVEIQARIDNYNKLGETAKTVITNIKGFVKDYDTAMQESFKLLQPTMQEQWVKDVVASIAKLSKALVDAFKQPFIDEFDPINGKGLVKVIAEWGHTLISYYGIGIESGIENLKKSILKTLAEAIQPYLETHSPPEKGALHNINIWGYQTGQLYTQSFGQGITDGNIYVNDGLTKTADTVQKVNKKIAYEYSPKNLGMATMIGTSDLTALKDVLKQLTADPLVKGMWSAREQEYASSDKEFGAFSKALDLQVNKAEIEKQNSILNITDTAAKVEQFYKQFNKGLLSPDMGDISEELVRKQIQDQPYLSTFYWYGKQLQQQYPEIYKNLVADGTIIPSSTGEIKNKAGEVIGRTQTGSYRDRYSVDYQEQDYAGATGFNDWLQSKFNDWLVENQNMVDPDTGKTIQSSGYNPTLARDKFLGGWSDDRLADIMTEYQNYVKGLGTVKSVQDYEKAIMENYAGTSIANALATGQDMDKTLVNSDWGNTLLTNKQKAKYQDKTIKTGVGIYDSKGVRQEGLEVLAGMNTAKGGVGSGGLGSAGKVAALIKANGSYVITSKNNTIIFTIPRGDTLPPQDFDYDELGINDIMKLFEVDYETAEDMWKKNRHFKINFAGAKTQGLMGGMSGFAASGDVTKLPEGYTIKDIFTTIKGDYAGGVDALAQMAGNLDSDKRKLILDNLVARIDEQYPNTTTTKDQSEVGGGVVSGDYIKVDATETRDYTAVRAGLKDQVARMLGFDKEFSVARGWRNALGADVENTANEEILKWIELTSDEIRKMTPGIDDPIVESENYQKTREYLQDIIADKGVTPDLLKDFQTALNAAMQLGYIDKSEAAKLVSTLLPSGVDIKEQVGLTTFRGGTKEIEGFSWIDALLQSPWGGQSSTPYGQEGMRQLMEKYTDLAPVVTTKTGDYSNKYKITDNAFKYYERATKGWQPGFSWTDLNAPIQIPATEPELIPYTGETPTAYGGGYPVIPGFVGGFGSYMDYGGGNYTLPPSPSINMGTGNRVSTFSSGSGNTFYFSVNIAKMDVANGEDFGDQFIEAITDKMKNIGVTI